MFNNLTFDNCKRNYNLSTLCLQNACVYIQSWLLVCVQNTIAVIILTSIYLEYLMHHAALLNFV